MLRVRPVLSTSRIEPWRHLLTTAGMVCASDDGGDWLEFDAASGRLALRRVAPGDEADGRVDLGFEVRDLDEFVRRTLADGTRAEIVEADNGRAARIAAPSGFTFLAESASASFGNHPEGTQPDPALSVMPVWMTRDVAGASATLRGIGAHPRFSGSHGEWTDFSAKNGGVVAVQDSTAENIILAWEYDDDLAVLRDRLTSAGIGCSPTGQAGDDTLLVEDPDGADSPGGGHLRFNARQTDQSGHPAG